MRGLGRLRTRVVSDSSHYRTLYRQWHYERVRRWTTTWVRNPRFSGPTIEEYGREKRPPTEFGQTCKVSGPLYNFTGFGPGWCPVPLVLETPTLDCSRKDFGFSTGICLYKPWVMVSTTHDGTNLQDLERVWGGSTGTDRRLTTTRCLRVGGQHRSLWRRHGVEWGRDPHRSDSGLKTGGTGDEIGRRERGCVKRTLGKRYGMKRVLRERIRD